MYAIKRCENCKGNYQPKTGSAVVCENCRKKKCESCGKSYILEDRFRKSRFCSRRCYVNFHFGRSDCLKCGEKISFGKYCSKQCRSAMLTRFRWEKIQKAKADIIKELGGECRMCGNTDFRVLHLDHIDASRKSRKYYRKGAPISWTARLKDWKENGKNLQPLCANCHIIKTFYANT